MPVQEEQEPVPQGEWYWQWKLKVPAVEKVMIWGQVE